MSVNTSAFVTNAHIPRLHYFPFDNERAPTPFHVNSLFPQSEKKQFTKTEEKLRECETTPVESFGSVASLTASTVSTTVNAKDMPEGTTSTTRHLLIVRGRVADANPYHSLVMDPKLFCTYLYTAVLHPSTRVDLFIEDEFFPTNANTRDALEALLVPNGGTIYTPSEPPPDPALFHAIAKQRRAISSSDAMSDILIPNSHHNNFVSTFPLWASWGFEIGRVHDPRISGFADTIKANLGVKEWGSGDGTGTVLVLDRETNRCLGGYRKLVQGGYEWGKHDIVIDALSKRGLPVRSIAFNSSLPTAAVVRAVAKAKVMIGVHGAGLTHAMWMRRGSTLIEVINRSPLYYGGGQQGTRGYHKADFANLARAFGIRYYYKDSKGIVAKNEGDFNYETGLVDVDEFAEQVERAFYD